MRKQIPGNHAECSNRKHGVWPEYWQHACSQWLGWAPQKRFLPLERRKWAIVLGDKTRTWKLAFQAHETCYTKPWSCQSSKFVQELMRNSLQSCGYQCSSGKQQQQKGWLKDFPVAKRVKEMFRKSMDLYTGQLGSLLTLRMKTKPAVIVFVYKFSYSFWAHSTHVYY